MSYTSGDLFIDESELSLWFSEYLKRGANNIKNIVLQLSDIDYYRLLINFLQALPEALIIMFLGFFAVYNLLKITENVYGNKFYPIITSSMSPAIKSGSLIYSVSAKTYSIGDIVSYTEKTKEGTPTGKILTHRLIKETGNGKFIAKGDANPDADPLEISGSQIQGKVAKVIPHIGYIEVITKTLPGFLVLILLPCFFIIKKQIYELKSHIRSGSLPRFEDLSRTAT